MDSILQVNNLTKQYDGFKLDHVSFSVPKGAIMGLIGENGAGKSTTINAILDLIYKDEGTVTFGGRSYRDRNSSKRILEWCSMELTSMKLSPLPKSEKSVERPTNSGMHIYIRNI